MTCFKAFILTLDCVLLVLTVALVSVEKVLCCEFGEIFLYCRRSMARWQFGTQVECNSWILLRSKGQNANRISEDRGFNSTGESQTKISPILSPVSSFRRPLPS